ncbi:MAG: hypothetical protein Q8Q94_01955 [bacterium]|nr:hypothetical protein [bacterium]MDZ4299723.1 hypothetical protein [Candidatus Sungbacteria bacterium]
MVIKNKIWIPLVAVVAALAAGLVFSQSGSVDDFGSVTTTSAHPRVFQPAASADPDEAITSLFTADTAEDALLKEDEREASDLDAETQILDNPDQLFNEINY